MAKDPAFLFYSNDFLTGIADLTMEERGQYITILCLEHQKGRLSDKAINMVCHGIASADVLSKFSQDENGLWYNVRLEEEIQKRKQHSDKQRDRAKDGWKKRKDVQCHGNATAMPLENENESIVFNNNGMFKKEDCGELPEIMSGSIQELLKFTKNKKVSINQIRALWPVFLTQNVTGKKYYANIEAVHSHFMNWIKNQSFEELKAGAEINQADEKIRQALKNAQNARNGITA
jgi:uncharacterized protein YdaU (DUF1376 family)